MEPFPEAAQDLIGNRAGPFGEVAGGDFEIPGSAYDHSDRTGIHIRYFSYIHKRLIHAFLPLIRTWEEPLESDLGNPSAYPMERAAIRLGRVEVNASP